VSWSLDTVSAGFRSGIDIHIVGRGCYSNHHPALCFVLASKWDISGILAVLAGQSNTARHIDVMWTIYCQCSSCRTGISFVVDMFELSGMLSALVDATSAYS
jgi:hypothetical protein